MITDGGVAEALTLLRAGVDGLLGADLSGLSGVAVAELLSLVEVQRRRLAAVDVAVVAQADARGVAGEFAQTGTAELLMTLLRVSPGEARRRVAAAQVLGPRRTVCGEPLAPVLSSSAEALRAGVVSGGQVEVIAGCLRAVERVPGLAVPEVAPVVERVLLEAAGHEHPRALARTAQVLLARLDPDGVEPGEQRAQRRRDLALHKNADGSSVARGQLTAEATAVGEAVLDSLAVPAPATDGVADDRTPGQRRHDGFLDAGRRLLRSGSLPEGGGAPVTILLTTTKDEFDSGRGLARTGHGDLWPMTAVRHLADAADIITVVDDPRAAVVAFGRTRRLASAGQRRALAARDGGCCFPGCTRPAAWTEAHHLVSWLDGGRTDIDNLCLLCGFHHREFTRRGWQVHMAAGRPHWTPPRWLDPDQHPRRNTAHHLPDLTPTRRGTTAMTCGGATD